MAEGINFNSESFDDDASAESDKDKKKKKKKAGDVGKAVVDGIVGSGAEGLGKERPKQSLFDQLKGWLADEAIDSKSAAKKEGAKKEPIEIVSGKEVADMPVAASEAEEAAIARAKDILSAKDDEILPDFRKQLASDELSEGEGVINLRGGEEGALPEKDIFQKSVERDLSLIETVESDDEEAAVRRAPAVVNRQSSRMNRPDAEPGMQVPVLGETMQNTPDSSFKSLLTRRFASETARLASHTRGVAEGIVAGVLIGGGVEHGIHTAREKAEARKNKSERQKQKKAVEQLRTRTSDLEEKHDDVVRTMTKQRLEYEQRLHADAEAVIVAQTTEAAATTKALAAEKAKADSEKEKADLIERLNAQAAEQERLKAEALLKNPEHRIETSAWHAMEVDKSGHIVQDGSLEYGHEYYSERAHETGPKEQFDAKAGSTAVAAAFMAAGAPSAPASSAVTDTSSPTQIIAASSRQPTSLPPLVGISDDADTSESHLSPAAIIPWLVLLVIIGVVIVVLT